MHSLKYLPFDSLKIILYNSRGGRNANCIVALLEHYIVIIYRNINQLDALNFIMSLFHASTCFEHKCSSSGGQRVHRTATYRCDDTRGSIVQFWPPDDEHMCSKHVEAWNKLIIKLSATSWLILR